MPSLLLYYLGYLPREKYNSNAIETNCNVTAYVTESYPCSGFGCMCKYDGSDTECPDWINGIITVEYTDQNNIQHHQYKLQSFSNVS